MNRGVNRRRARGTILFWAVLFVVCAGAWAQTQTQTVVLPLIGRPGICLYCQYVEKAFTAAETSIDLLLMDARLEENPLWDDLLAAFARGVTIRVLLDESDWAPSITARNRPTIEYLRSHGIDARFDDPAVTTHAKLVVVDRRVVILGSTNWNRHSFTNQEQADVVIKNAQVGEIFAYYFDRLWSGTLIPAGVKLDFALLDIEEQLIIPLPETVGTGNYARLLLKLLGRAQRSVHVVMYRVSYYPAFPASLSNEILRALIDAAARGLDVRILIDDIAFFPRSAAANLAAANHLASRGVEVRFDDPDETTHAKLVIIDYNAVLLGSTNWNYYALEMNNEVALAFIGFPDIAAPFTNFFETLWREGRER